MPDLLAADLSHFWSTHSASAHTGTTRTHTHTITHHHHHHTNSYKRLQPETHTKVSTNTYSKQELLPIYEICRFLWLVKAKKLFARVSSGRAICEDDFKAKSCALSFSTLQALSKPYHVRLKALTEFCVAPFSFPWQRCEGL